MLMMIGARQLLIRSIKKKAIRSKQYLDRSSIRTEEMEVELFDARIISRVHPSICLSVFFHMCKVRGIQRTSLDSLTSACRFPKCSKSRRDI